MPRVEELIRCHRVGQFINPPYDATASGEVGRWDETRASGDGELLTCGRMSDVERVWMNEDCGCHFGLGLGLGKGGLVRHTLPIITLLTLTLEWAGWAWHRFADAGIECNGGEAGEECVLFHNINEYAHLF
jgi:hypothetical protein